MVLSISVIMRPEPGPTSTILNPVLLAIPPKLFYMAAIIQIPSDSPNICEISGDVVKSPPLLKILSFVE